MTCFVGPYRVTRSIDFFTSLAPLHALVGTAWKPLADLRIPIWGLANKAYMKPCSIQPCS